MRTLICLAIVGLVMSGNLALAAGPEAEVAEVFIADGKKPKTDILVRLVWTGSGNPPAGNHGTYQIPSSTFGDKGVSRVQSLLLAALLSNKTVEVQLNGNYLTAVRLKAKRD